MFRRVLLCLFMLSKADLQNHTYTSYLCLPSLFSVSSSIKKILAHDCNAAAAATAKSLQSCPILCDPRDGSLPGSPVPGILQARTLEWGAMAFSDDCNKKQQCDFTKYFFAFCL